MAGGVAAQIRVIKGDTFPLNGDPTVDAANESSADGGCIDDGETGLLADFSECVASPFSRITGGEANLKFDGQISARVVRGSFPLPPDRLSHGGGGALAIAVRLAMAEAYPQGHGGLIMLDDPLVHFDKDRMAVAADVLRMFSATTQVLFFTCPDHRRARLGGNEAQADQADLTPIATG